MNLQKVQTPPGRAGFGGVGIDQRRHAKNITASDYIELAEPVARLLCGEPNIKQCSATELRFGTNGSLSVDLTKGTWYDHESEEGGGVLQLVGRYTRIVDRAGQHRWLQEQRLVEASPRPEPIRSQSPAATYDYRDEAGELLFQVVRRQPKDFRQRCPDGKGGWDWSVKGVRQVPYRLDQLHADPAALVYVVEGEKDADRLTLAGLLATCNAGGAGKWHTEHAEHLAGREVVILPDNDEAGRKHAADVAASLHGIAASVRTIELDGLPAKGDVSDWLDAGHSADELRALVIASEPDTAPPALLQRVELGDLMSATVPPPRFVIDPLIPRGVVTLLGGHGGIGKSSLALTLSAHVACGRGWACFEVEPCQVVFVSLEDDAGVVRYRLRRIIEEYALPAAEVVANLTIFDGTDVEAALMTEVSDQGTRALVATPMMAEVEKAGAGAGLVVIDNASDAFDGDENSRRQVRTFVRRLAGIAKGNEAGLVLLAHIDKKAARGGAEGNSYSGSTAWHNSARSRLAMLELEDGSVELRQEKLNLGKKADPLALTQGAHGVVLLPGPGDTTARVAAADLVARSDADAVLESVRLAIDAGITVTTAVAGPLTACHALESLPEHSPLYRGRAGRVRVAAALVRLAREGRIVRVEYRKPTRKPGERWELAHSTSPEAP